MEKDKRTGWLKDLKVGDEVFLIGELLHEVFLQKIAIIETITPAGRIRAGGYKFNQCGRFEKTDFCSVRLEKLTPEMKSKLLLNTERERLEAKVKNAINDIDVSEFNNEELKCLSTFLKEFTD